MSAIKLRELSLDPSVLFAWESLAPGYVLIWFSKGLYKPSVAAAVQFGLAVL